MSFQQSNSLQGKFLVAMPSLADSEFEKAVIYMLEHNEQGAVGLIVNHPLNISVDDILLQVNENYSLDVHSQSVLTGGPVEKGRGFVLHHTSDEHAWQGEIAMDHGISATASADILHALADGSFDQQFLLIIGYSGWAAEQLEQELLESSWLIVDANPNIIFEHATEDLLDVVLAQLGIEYGQLSNMGGSA